MEQLIAAQKAQELKIDPVQVVREYWEMIMLRGLYESRYGRFLIFKGGTALRLAYGSPRFSEDLDFSLTGPWPEKEFPSLIKRIIASYPELKIIDLQEKYYTTLSEIKVTQNYLTLPFRLKIEISKRKVKEYQWQLVLLGSPASVVQVLAPVATLEQLYKDKIACLKDRAKPKDLFDLWYISKKLNLPSPPLKTPLKKQMVVRELRKYLPRDFWPAINGLMV